MRLRSYVLAARLEQVAAAATARLRQMSGGRYGFVHSDELPALVGRAEVPVPARDRLLRHPAHRRAQGLPDRVGRRRRWRVAGLRQHAVRAARTRSTATRSGAHITDWRAELAPYYDQAKRMLGVVENPHVTPADDVMEKVADDMGVGDTFHPTPVGVFFGGPGAATGEPVADPYFGGAGPERSAVHSTAASA
ncbi:MAG: hypothetical protein WKF47_14880 [Geodermatophilaceae bacterium]